MILFNVSSATHLYGLGNFPVFPFIFPLFFILRPLTRRRFWFNLFHSDIKSDAYVFKFCLAVPSEAEPFYIRRIPIIHIFPQTYYTELFFKKAVFIICICIFRYNIICSVATGSAQLRGAYA